MKKAFKILVPILMVLLILASLVWYGFVYDRDLVRDIFLKQARYLSTHGQASLSSWFYDLAYEHSGQSNNVAIELANQFKKSGNYTKAESTLSGAIADSPTMELYMALSELYVEEDKIIDAMAMIDNVIDPVIAQQMYYERPAAPTVNVEPGFYNEYIPVELSCENGTVYYVLNDEFPSFATGIYNGPITLPAGETTINAIVVTATVWSALLPPSPIRSAVLWKKCSSKTMQLSRLSVSSWAWAILSSIPISFGKLRILLFPKVFKTWQIFPGFFIWIA